MSIQEQFVAHTATFGLWLHKNRKRKGLTQAELARRVFCAESNISHLEHDRSTPSEVLVRRIAKVLGVPANQIDDLVSFARGLPQPQPLHVPTAYATPTNIGVAKAQAWIIYVPDAATTDPTQVLNAIETALRYPRYDNDKFSVDAGIS